MIELHCRNLTDNADLALMLEPLITAKARANLSAGGGSAFWGRQNSAQPTKTRAEGARFRRRLPRHDRQSEADRRARAGGVRKFRERLVFAWVGSEHGSHKGAAY
jgi:hypothetical protein